MYQDPELRLQLALRRQAELRSEADRRPRTRITRIGHHRFTGLHLHLGGFIVAVGRTLCEEEAPRTRPLHP